MLALSSSRLSTYLHADSYAGEGGPTFLPLSPCVLNSNPYVDSLVFKTGLATAYTQDWCLTFGCLCLGARAKYRYGYCRGRDVASIHFVSQSEAANGVSARGYNIMCHIG